MTGAPLRWRRALIAILPIVTCLDGCASMRHADAAVAPEFLGVWAAHGADSRSWWEIRADRVVNYEASVDGQSCEGRAVIVLSGDVLDIGNRVRLYRAADELVVARGTVRAAFGRASAQDICRRADGTYLENAPYMVKKLLKGRMA
jgi:hypothetical protein